MGMGYHKRRIIMEEDYQVWLRFLEDYYGKEYVEQLLRDVDKNKDKVDANRQDENGEWGYQKDWFLLAAAFVSYNKNTAWSDEVCCASFSGQTANKHCYLIKYYTKFKLISLIFPRKSDGPILRDYGY